MPRYRRSKESTLRARSINESCSSGLWILGKNFA